MPDDNQQRFWQFAHDLNKLAEQMDTAIETVVGRVALSLFTNIIDNTPVDTGRLRAGWDLTIGEPSEYLPAPASRKKGLAPEYAEAPVFPNVIVKLDLPIFIINNVVYAQPIEYGHSKEKAPLGMVRPAMLATEIEFGL